MIYYRLWLIFFHPKIDTLLVLPFSEDFQIRVSDSRLDILTNSERKWNIHISISKFGCWQQKQTKFSKLKTSLLFNGSLNTSHQLYWCYPPTVLNNLKQYWRYPPHVLLLSPTVLKVSLHSTEYPPQYWCYPPTVLTLSPHMYWCYPPTVLNNLHSTEAIPHSTEAIPPLLSNLHSTEAIPPQYWCYPHSTDVIPPHVLMLSPTVLNNLHSTEAIPPQYWSYPPTVLKLSPHSTEAIPPQYWSHPPLYWATSTVLKLSPTVLMYPPNVLNNLQCTEQPPQYWNRRYMGWRTTLSRKSKGIRFVDWMWLL